MAPRYFKTLTAVTLFALAVLGAAEDAPSHVISLTDSNFDWTTQVSSGTAGDWFILFYSPECSICKRILPTMDALSVEILGKVNVAKVDVTVNPELMERFVEHGKTPAIWHFRKGTMTPYHGPNSVEGMGRFTRHGHKLEGGAMKKRVEQVAPKGWATLRNFVISLAVVGGVLAVVMVGSSAPKGRSV